ncbi:hypothetical protein ElyMa_006576900 [Elysia marginata]|uniref:Uncharacterized protein n=1 Tax=Elysia marginata TaxID=1093978 RepID=A0AAV4IBZ3_9GAST|nr:hypothetical protein ElyMa_006576900 [Elysia marginata]
MATKSGLWTSLLLLTIWVSLASTVPLNKPETDKAIENIAPTLAAQESSEVANTETLSGSDIKTTPLPSKSQSDPESVQEGGEEGFTPTEVAPPGNEDGGGEDSGPSEKPQEKPETAVGDSDVPAEKMGEDSTTDSLDNLDDVNSNDDDVTDDDDTGENRQSLSEPVSVTEKDSGTTSSRDVGVSNTEKASSSLPEQQDGRVTPIVPTTVSGSLAVDTTVKEVPLVTTTMEDGEELKGSEDSDGPESSTVGEVEDGDESDSTEKVKDTVVGDVDAGEEAKDGDDASSKPEMDGAGQFISTPAHTTSTQLGNGVSEAPAEPEVGRVVEKLDSFESTPPAFDNSEIADTEKITTQPADIGAAVSPTASTDDDNDDDEKDNGVGGSIVKSSEVDKENTKDELEDTTPAVSEDVGEASPTGESTVDDVTDSERELSVQTRADDDGGEIGGVDDGKDDSSSQTGDDKSTDDGDDSSETEGDVGKVVSLDDLTNDTKSNGEDEEADEGEDESSEKASGTKEDKVIDLEEAEKIWGGNSSEEGEEGSGSADEDIAYTESGDARAEGVHGDHSHDGHSHDGHSHDGQGHNSTDHGHGPHKDSAEDKENKKRTAIIVGVALGGAALLTLGVFTTRQCKQKAKFTPLQKAKEQNDPEAIEFRPVNQTSTALGSDSGTPSGRRPTALDNKNGLYRHGPSMGPPSPRVTRKADDGKFRFPESPTASPAITPLLGQSPAENGQRRTPNLSLAIKPPGGAANGDGPAVKPAKPANPEPTQGQPAQPEEPLMNGVGKLKYIDESTDDEGSVSAFGKPQPLPSRDQRLSNLVEEPTPASPSINQQTPPPDSSATEPADNSTPQSSEGV